MVSEHTSLGPYFLIFTSWYFLLSFQKAASDKGSSGEVCSEVTTKQCTCQDALLPDIDQSPLQLHITASFLLHLPTTSHLAQMTPWPHSLEAALLPPSSAPLEVRLIIYEELFKNVTFSPSPHQQCLTCKSTTKNAESAVLSTCRQIRSEAYPMLLIHGTLSGCKTCLEVYALKSRRTSPLVDNRYHVDQVRKMVIKDGLFDKHKIYTIARKFRHLSKLEYQLSRGIPNIGRTSGSSILNAFTTLSDHVHSMMSTIRHRSTLWNLQAAKDVCSSSGLQLMLTGRFSVLETLGVRLNFEEMVRLAPDPW